MMDVHSEVLFLRGLLLNAQETIEGWRRVNEDLEEIAANRLQRLNDEEAKVAYLETLVVDLEQNCKEWKLLAEQREAYIQRLETCINK